MFFDQQVRFINTMLRTYINDQLIYIENQYMKFYIQKNDTQILFLARFSYYAFI